MKKALGFAVSSIGLVSFVSLAFAAAPSAVFEISDKGKTAYCGQFSSGWKPVLYVAKTATYKAVSDELKTIAAKLKKAKTSKERASLSKKQTQLKALVSRTRTTCAAGPTSGGGTPIPTATPTPVLGIGCFLPGNNVKPGCFGIPTDLTGNLVRGQEYFQQNCSVSGCHLSRPAYDFARVDGAFSKIPQMAAFKPDRQTIADIVAYLNRANFG